MGQKQRLHQAETVIKQHASSLTAAQAEIKVRLENQPHAEPITSSIVTR